MNFNWADLMPSIERFLSSWKIVRLCPDKIVAPREQLSFNVLTLLVVVAIFLLARLNVAGANRDISYLVFSTTVSSLIVFATGFVVLILNPSAGIDNVRKWGLFFVLLWITSLLVEILVDGIPVWNQLRPSTSIVIDAIFGPGSLSDLVKDFLRSLLIGAIALMILVLKTKRMDRNFKIWSGCAFLTVLIGLFVNAILLVLFLYGNVF